MLKYLTAAAAFVLAACSPPAETPNADMGDMAAPSEVAGAITGTGTVTAIDAAAGTISLDHGPITAIQWPAMSMQFQAEDRTILQGIAVGDQVSFELKSASESSVVTSVAKQ